MSPLLHKNGFRDCKWWYDFLLYGVAAATVFPRKFFPESDSFIATLLSFSTFFVGFVGRPIGAAIFGHYGDRLGRRKLFIVTVMMSCAQEHRPHNLPPFSFHDFDVQLTRDGLNAIPTTSCSNARLLNEIRLGAIRWNHELTPLDTAWGGQ